MLLCVELCRTAIPLHLVPDTGICFSAVAMQAFWGTLWAFNIVSGRPLCMQKPRGLARHLSRRPQIHHGGQVLQAVQTGE